MMFDGCLLAEALAKAGWMMEIGEVRSRRLKKGSCHPELVSGSPKVEADAKKRC